MSRWGWLIAIFPRRFRRQHGDEIRRSLEDDLRDAREAGGWRGADRAARAIVDVGLAALLERVRAFFEWSALLAELRQAARTLRAAPGVTAIAALTLALPIGASTTIFSLVNGVILAPLPYAASDRLMIIWNDLGRGAQSLPVVNPGDFRDYQAWSRTFETFAAATGGGPVDVTGVITGGGAEPERVDVSAIGANLLPLLGVDPLLGRHFTNADEQPGGGPPVVLMGHGLWQRRFGGDPSLVGRTITLDGRSALVVGILPARFHLLLPAEAFLVRDAELWVPLRVDYTRLPPRNFTTFTVFGRLRRDVTVGQAQGEMDAIADRLRREHPIHRASQLAIRVVPLHHDVVKAVALGLWLLLGAVALVTLIGCANVAGLLLNRAIERRREIAVHTALGASRARLVRRLLMESLLLASLGTAGGVTLAALALPALASLSSPLLPRLDGVALDRTALAFALLVAIVVTLALGLVPAWRATRGQPAIALKSGSRGASAGDTRLRHWFVAAEVALAALLLTGTGLLVRSFAALQDVRPGFDAERVLTFRLALPAARYDSRAARAAFLRTVEARLRAIPGVTAVGAVSQLPLTGSGSLSPYAYDAHTSQHWESVTADGRNASPDFFEAIGARLVAGRAFTDADAGEPPVVIIDTELARRAWPDGRAVGRFLQVATADSPRPYAEVIGVIEHVHLHDLTRRVHPQIWRPLVAGVGMQVAIAVRTTADPARVASPVREAVRALGADLAISRVQPMTHYVRQASGGARFGMLLTLLFGAVALVLAAIGLYGVVAHGVSQRRRELAIRLALGQAPRAVQRMVLRQALTLGAVAALVGLAAAMLSGRILGRFLYGVAPTDPLTFVAVAAIVLLVTAAAAWTPAWRASRVDPILALRGE